MFENISIPGSEQTSSQDVSHNGSASSHLVKNNMSNLPEVIENQTSELMKNRKLLILSKDSKNLDSSFKNSEIHPQVRAGENSKGENSMSYANDDGRRNETEDRSDSNRSEGSSNSSSSSSSSSSEGRSCGESSDGRSESGSDNEDSPREEIVPQNEEPENYNNDFVTEFSTVTGISPLKNSSESEDEKEEEDDSNLPIEEEVKGLPSMLPTDVKYSDRDLLEKKVKAFQYFAGTEHLYKNINKAEYQIVNYEEFMAYAEKAGLQNYTCNCDKKKNFRCDLHKTLINYIRVQEEKDQIEEDKEDNKEEEEEGEKCVIFLRKTYRIGKNANELFNFFISHTFSCVTIPLEVVKNEVSQAWLKSFLKTEDLVYNTKPMAFNLLPCSLGFEGRGKLILRQVNLNNEENDFSDQIDRKYSEKNFISDINPTVNVKFLRLIDFNIENLSCYKEICTLEGESVEVRGNRRISLKAYEFNRNEYLSKIAKEATKMNGHIIDLKKCILDGVENERKKSDKISNLIEYNRQYFVVHHENHPILKLGGEDFSITYCPNFEVILTSKTLKEQDLKSQEKKVVKKLKEILGEGCKSMKYVFKSENQKNNFWKKLKQIANSKDKTFKGGDQGTKCLMGYNPAENPLHIDKGIVINAILFFESKKKKKSALRAFEGEDNKYRLIADELFYTDHFGIEEALIPNFRDWIKSKPEIIESIIEDFRFMEIDFKKNSVFVQGIDEELDNFIEKKYEKDFEFHARKIVKLFFSSGSREEIKIEDEKDFKKTLDWIGLFFTKRMISKDLRVYFEETGELKEPKQIDYQIYNVNINLTKALCMCYLLENKEKLNFDYTNVLKSICQEQIIKEKDRLKDNFDTESKYIWCEEDEEGNMRPMSMMHNYYLEKWFRIKKKNIDKIINGEFDDDDLRAQATEKMKEKWGKNVEYFVKFYHKEEKEYFDWGISISRKKFSKICFGEETSLECSRIIEEEADKIYRFESYQEVFGNEDPLNSERVKIKEKDIEEDYDAQDEPEDNSDHKDSKAFYENFCCHGKPTDSIFCKEAIKISASSKYIMEFKEEIIHFLKEKKRLFLPIDNKHTAQCLVGDWNSYLARAFLVKGDKIESVLKKKSKRQNYKKIIEASKASKNGLNSCWHAIFFGFFLLMNEFLGQEEKAHEASTNFLSGEWEEIMNKFIEDTEVKYNEFEQLEVKENLPVQLEGFTEDEKRMKSKRSAKDHPFYFYKIYNLMIKIACDSIQRYYQPERISQLFIFIYDSEDRSQGRRIEDGLKIAKSLCKIQNYGFFLMKILQYRKEISDKYSQKHFKKDNPVAVAIICDFIITDEKTDMPYVYPRKIVVCNQQEEEDYDDDDDYE